MQQVFGGDEFIVMAGPYLVESEKQILESAELVLRSTAPSCCAAARSSRALRPTTSRGSKLEGLKLLDKARRATGLGIITEVMSDAMWILVAGMPTFCR